MFTKTRSASALTNFVSALRNRKKIALSCIVRVQEFSSTDPGDKTGSFNVGANYTVEQEVLILNKINTCTVDELKCYHITEARIKKLTAHRERYGSFKSLNQVLLMQGIDISVLDRFCKSIVKGEQVPKLKTKNSKAQLLTPALENDVRTNLTTFTGIRVSRCLVSWAQVDTSCNLLYWECETLEDVAMKDGLVAVVEAVANVVSKVPPSHAYVMESDSIVPFSRMSSVAYYLQLQRQQIVSTIVTLLGTREQRFGGTDESRTLINNIYMMRSRTVSRLFDLLIGTEEVSAQGVVEKILSGDENAKIHINADPAVREMYRMQNSYEREQMNWALLLTSAFVDLSILRTAPQNPPRSNSKKLR